MIEIEIRFLLKSLGLDDLSSEYSSQDLITIATQINPQRVSTVAQDFEKFRAFKSFKEWNSFGSSFIIDRVFGLDYITKIEQGKRIGFCFVSNPDRVEEEIENVKDLSPLWKSLDVFKVIVLLPIVSCQEFTFFDKDKSQDNLLNIITHSMNNSSEVLAAKINLQ
jgi:hypothetical protein